MPLQEACPVCLQSIPTSLLEQHVSLCLEQAEKLSNDKKKQEEEDERLARQLARSNSSEEVEQGSPLKIGFATADHAQANELLNVNRNSVDTASSHDYKPLDLSVVDTLSKRQLRHIVLQQEKHIRELNLQLRILQQELKQMRTAHVLCALDPEPASESHQDFFAGYIRPASAVDSSTRASHKENGHADRHSHAHPHPPQVEAAKPNEGQQIPVQAAEDRLDESEDDKEKDRASRSSEHQVSSQGLGALAHLPREILVQILSGLSGKELCNLAGVSHDMHTLSLDDSLWKALYFQHRLSTKREVVARAALAGSSSTCTLDVQAKLLPNETYRDNCHEAVKRMFVGVLRNTLRLMETWYWDARTKTLSSSGFPRVSFLFDGTSVRMLSHALNGYHFLWDGTILRLHREHKTWRCDYASGIRSFIDIRECWKFSLVSNTQEEEWSVKSTSFNSSRGVFIVKGYIPLPVVAVAILYNSRTI